MPAVARGSRLGTERELLNGSVGFEADVLLYKSRLAHPTHGTMKDFYWAMYHDPPPPPLRSALLAPPPARSSNASGALRANTVPPPIRWRHSPRRRLALLVLLVML